MQFIAKESWLWHYLIAENARTKRKTMKSKKNFWNLMEKLKKKNRTIIINKLKPIWTINLISSGWRKKPRRKIKSMRNLHFLWLILSKCWKDFKIYWLLIRKTFSLRFLKCWMNNWFKLAKRRNKRILIAYQFQKEEVRLEGLQLLKKKPILKIKLIDNDKNRIDN